MLTIRSGGQTGVDRAALDAALSYNDNDDDNESFINVHVTGWCPKGRLAEDGQISLKYPLIETSTSLHSERTEWNIRDSDATLVILITTGSIPCHGTTFTIEKSKELHKPVKIITLDNNDNINNDSQVIQVIRWMNENKIKTLNVAGP
ncbi:hypothetical protein Glove_21g377 [Diversispora epigaea]|uniref:Molybdenum cofactor carrier n=1 Tax=Diversispora epigaea TaxID=1348612 RepID=A0A397JTT9_9GLOM|nr:hypothetical protein Glove_21g377 [Diversispora epigaea]